MSSARRPRFRWQLHTRSMELGERTLVMGILNVTPDSFSDGGRFALIEDALARGIAMLDEGADLLDLGGESTRPDAIALSADEEQQRVLTVIAAILHERPDAVLSIDTYHASTARLAVGAGAEIVNDVSGGLWDKAMLGTCAELAGGVVLMHTRGKPGEWRELPSLAASEVVPLVCRELAERADAARVAGIKKSALVLDPGFGFGKLGGENYSLLAGLEKLRELGFPLLAGVSRKGFLAQTLAGLGRGVAPSIEHRLHATLAAHTAAILSGAHILRVHDVLPAVEAAAVTDAILAAG